MHHSAVVKISTEATPASNYSQRTECFSKTTCSHVIKIRQCRNTIRLVSNAGAGSGNRTRIISLKAEVIAIIRYPHMVPTTGIKLVPTDYKSVALPAELSRHWFFRGAISPIKEEFPSEPFSIIRFNIPIATTLCVKLCKFIYVFLFYVNISPSFKIYATIYKQIYFEGNY